MMNKLMICILPLLASSAQAQNNNGLMLALNEPPASAVLERQTENVSPQEAATLLSGKQAVIVDVREDDEWNKQHIPGAIHIPLGRLSERASELGQYKNAPIITQCQKGGRSQQALDVLKSLKFSKVYNLEGGLDAWNEAGLKTD